MNIDPVSAQQLMADPRAGSAPGILQGHQIPSPDATSWQGQVTDAVQRLFANGTTAQRPLNPVLGQMFYDTTINMVIVCAAIASGNNVGNAIWKILPGQGVMFEVEQHTAQVLVANTQTVVTFDTVVLNPRAWWNAGTSQFLPNIPGVYYFYAGLTYLPPAGVDYQLTTIRKNGVGTRPTIETSTVGQLFQLQASRIYTLNGITDFVDVTAYSLAGCPTGGPILGNAFSYFGGYLISS
jgi:hypothetical protein